MPHTYTTYSIGNSFEGRPIPIHVFESTTKPVFRILINGGIHGIEPETAAGAQVLVDDIRTGNPTFYDNVSIAVIPKFNVDGLIYGIYDNADGWQLQIDALLRMGVETRSFFKFANQFKPNVYIDGHNLDAWNRGASNYLLDRGLHYSADTVISRNDSIAARKDTTWKQYDDIIAYLNNTQAPYTYDRYWEFYVDEESGIFGEVSYYVPDISIYHHFIANRYNAVTFLIEGISPQDVYNPQEREAKAIASSFRCFKGIIGYLKQHPQIVGSTNTCSYPIGTEIPVRWDYIWEKKQYSTTNVVNDDDGSPSNQRLVSSSYRFLYEPTDYVTVPLGYAYPNTEVFETLGWYLFGEEGNYFTGYVGSTTDQYEIETIHVHSFTPGEVYFTRADYGWSKGPSDVFTSEVGSTMTNFSNYVVIRCDQEGGNIIPHLLEPKAQYAYTRYPDFSGLGLVQDSDYPVVRLIKRLA